eukprot:5234680-Amphidinium_carterae.1
MCTKSSTSGMFLLVLAMILVEERPVYNAPFVANFGNYMVDKWSQTEFNGYTGVLTEESQQMCNRRHNG